MLVKLIFSQWIISVPTELEIVRKETFNNWYKARTYFLANTLTTTPIHVSVLWQFSLIGLWLWLLEWDSHLNFQIIFATIYSTIIYFLTDQPMELNRYSRFTLAYILLTIVADGLGLLLGAIANPIVRLHRFPCDDREKKTFIILNYLNFSRMVHFGQR